MKRLLLFLSIFLVTNLLFSQSRTPVYEGVNGTTSEVITNSFFPGYNISAFRGYYKYSIFDYENSKYSSDNPDEWNVRIEYTQYHSLFFDYNNDGKVDYLGHLNDITRNTLNDESCGGTQGPGVLFLDNDVKSSGDISHTTSPFHFAFRNVVNDFNGDGKYNEVLATSEDGHIGTSCEMYEKPNTHKLLFFNESGLDHIDSIGPEFFSPSHGVPATGDIDNDGDVDIISIPFTDSKNGKNEEIPYFLINDGNGNFTEQNDLFLDQQKLQDELISFRCTTHRLFDINKDGNLDFIVGAKLVPKELESIENTQFITIFWGDGTGHYGFNNSMEFKLSKHVETSLNKIIMNILPNDYDGDGDLDIFVLSSLHYSGTVIDLYENNNLTFTDIAYDKFDINSFYRGNTIGIWQTNDQMPDFYSLFFYDYEGDGDFDLYPFGMGDPGTPNRLVSGYEFWENKDGKFYYRKDTDRDNIVDEYDNCPNVYNPDQKDSDNDGVGDVCEPDSDTDNDGIKNSSDNSPYDYNPNQEDLDGDGIGNVSDPDMIILSISELDPEVPNHYQENNFLEEKIHYNLIRAEQTKFEYYNSEEFTIPFREKKVAGGIQTEVTTDNVYSQIFRGGRSLVYAPSGQSELYLSHINNKYVDLNLSFFHGDPEVNEKKTLRVYVDQYNQKTQVAETKSQGKQNVIKHNLNNPYKYDHFDLEGDLHSKWEGASFESHVIPFDFANNGGKKDLIIGDYRVNFKGRNLNIHQISEPIYLMNQGNNTFESSSNFFDDPNLEPNLQKINTSIFHNPQMYEMVDLNGDGNKELLNFGEHYHIDGHQHFSKIVELMREKYGLELGKDYNQWGFKKHRYYSIKNTHEKRYQLFDKVSNIIEPEGQKGVFVSSYGNTVGDIDNDGDIDVVVASQTNTMGYVFDVLNNDGNGILTVNRTVENKVVTSEGKMLMYDINNDGFKDLIFGGQEGETKSDHSVFGYFLNNGNGNFDYDFKEIATFHPSLGLRNIYVSEIDESINQIIAYFSTGFGSNGGGMTLKDIPNLIKIYNVNKETSEFTDVTSTYFSPNQNEMNYYTQTGWVKYIDLDGDGNKDIVPKFHLEDPDLGWNYEGNAFRGNWNNSEGFQYFRFNPASKKFDLLNLGKLSDDKFYNDFDFVDVYNDDKVEWITFDKNPGGTGDLTIFEFDYKSDDLDNDGILNNVDNCPNTYNPDQKDTDGDGIGDVCDSNFNPSISSSEFTIAENPESNAVIGTVIVTDTDENDSHTFSININSYVKIDESIGTLTVSETALFDYESVTSFTLTVTVSDGTNSNSKEITINLTNINDPPTTTSTSTTVVEQVSSDIGLQGSDVDGDSLTYSVVQQPSNGTATVSGSVLTYVSTSDTATSDVITYKVNDGTVDSNISTITVTITPVNDKPTAIQSTNLSLPESSTISTSITTLNAQDPDGDTITYSIESGNESGTFSLIGDELILATALDYEITTIYELVIKASDGVLSSTSTLTINVEDVPNQSVEETLYITVYDVLNEDLTSRVDYSTMTQISEGVQTTIYEISGGVDSNLFTINPQTGGLNFITPPDYENPSDSNGDNVYEITIRMTNIVDGSTEVPVVTMPTSIAVPEANPIVVDEIPTIIVAETEDTDEDGIVDVNDNCPLTANADQADMDNDGVGDVCDDSDNDGYVDAIDQCPNSPFGSMIDAYGCEVFNLPSNNYSIEVTSATCIGSTNGAVTISAQNRTYTYNVIVTGQSTLTLSSTNSHTVDLNNLATGNYELCFTVEGQDSYRQCFSVQVGEPAPLSASSKVDYGNKSVSLSMDGSEIYNIRLNGNEFTTKSSEITLDLKPGMNYLEVTTDLSCQGTYFKEIFVSEEVIVYPNPTEDWVQIYVGGLDTKVNVTLRELNGVISYTQEMEVPDNRVLELDLTGKYPGIYFIGLQSKTVQSNLKVIKK